MSHPTLLPVAQYKHCVYYHTHSCTPNSCIPLITPVTRSGGRICSKAGSADNASSTCTVFALHLLPPVVHSTQSCTPNWCTPLITIVTRSGGWLCRHEHRLSERPDPSGRHRRRRRAGQLARERLRRRRAPPASASPYNQPRIHVVHGDCCWVLACNSI